MDFENFVDDDDEEEYDDEYDGEEEEEEEEASLLAAEVDALPDGWGEALEEGTGRPYYFNHGTGEVTWERPKAAGKKKRSKKKNSKVKIGRADGFGGSGESKVGEVVDDVVGDVADMPLSHLRRLGLHDSSFFRVTAAKVVVSSWLLAHPSHPHHTTPCCAMPCHPSIRSIHPSMHPFI